MGPEGLQNSKRAGRAVSTHSMCPRTSDASTRADDTPHDVGGPCGRPTLFTDMERGMCEGWGR
eukprot:9646096-Alexandrium_andersonii.AAC.1